jgi:hypothetical protein
MRRDRRRPLGSAAGQASIEVLAAIPFVLIVAILCLQLLAAGYALSLADGAVEAGALALAGGREARAAVEEALPDWARGRMDLEREGGRLTLRLRPPSPLEPLARELEVSSSAWVRPPATEAPG